MPAIRTIELGINNLYLIGTDEGAILVDAGPDFTGAWNQLIANVVGAGFGPQDVKFVLITHFHSDHAGLGQRWREVGATVMAGAGDAWHLARGPESYPEEVEASWVFMRENGVPDDLTAGLAETILEMYAHSRGESEGAPMPTPDPDAVPDLGEWYPAPLRMTAVGVTPLVDGDAITLGGIRVEAVSTPGHTPGSTCFWEPESKTLFTGDHVIPGIFSNPSLYFERNDPAKRIRSTPAYIESVQKLRAFPVERVAAGHKRQSEPLPRMIERILHHHHRRLERFAASIDSTPRTLYELAEQSYARLIRRDLWYVMGEVTGLVDVLEDAGRVVREREGDVVRVRLAT